MPAFNKGQVLAIHFHPVRRARTCLKQKGNRAKVTVREVSIIVGLALCIAPMKSVDGERQRPVIRVSLDVSASDDLRGVITSYLARELRKIDDVTVSVAQSGKNLSSIAATHEIGVVAAQAQ